MKKLLLLTLAIATLTSEGYSQTTPPIQRGGIVVYEKDGHGLVAAPKDLGKMTWNSAKKACANLVLNGFSDWRLPSKEELNSLYVYKDTIGGFVNYYYWSSTEYLDDMVWIKDFDNGKQYYGYFKSSEYDVRAVRAF
jgi:hypothetical protein